MAQIFKVRAETLLQNTLLILEYVQVYVLIHIQAVSEIF